MTQKKKEKEMETFIDKGFRCDSCGQEIFSVGISEKRYCFTIEKDGNYYEVMFKKETVKKIIKYLSESL